MIDWKAPAQIESPYGTLLLNQQSAVSVLVEGNDVRGWFLFDPARCQATRNLRVERDRVPQGDGMIFHRRFTEGTEFEVAAELWQAPVGHPAPLVGTNVKPACDELARLMEEELLLHLGGILNGDGRYRWSPTGHIDNRFLDEARWLIGTQADIADGVTTVTFTIDSPFPYVIDATQDTVSLVDGAMQTIANDGNTPFYPVIQVQGAATTFTIENQTTGFQIAYDSGRPGAQDILGGEYAEIDTYRNTVYLNGDEDNLKPGIDPTISDFFPLEPGNNDILITGADADVLVNAAYTP